MEDYFSQFRNQIIGINQKVNTPYGEMPLIYADWVASGRLYQKIEQKIVADFGPYVANTHTETSETGILMTLSYHKAQHIIKDHVNANEDDIIIMAGFGMTSVVNKLQRMLGLRSCGMVSHHNCLKELTDCEKPIVFITHMEHHSNQTSWIETCAEVVVLQPDENLLVSPDELRRQLEKYKDRTLKIGSFSACSNVTGIETPYHELASIMHEYGGYCFVDFAASAPYVDINMHPEDPTSCLDAIFFSPHKFLGGPGTSGVLIFCSKLYHNMTPDQPGGGTVDWTNPWGEYKYSDNIETREDGGTPGFLQTIRTALCIDLKNKMGTENIRNREKELVDICFEKMAKIPGLHILAENVKHRLGIVSFYFEHIHYNMVVKLLSDKFGIQMRGGCACAGTYGHFLLDVTYEQSKNITQLINSGDLSLKPGWVRLSLHPTMTKMELGFIIDAIAQIAQNYLEWAKDYVYNKKTNEFTHINRPNSYYDSILTDWFSL
ncbi:MAG: aminotransferase class V-fold PLP-dependent enzyme [Bacteroidota bacterium]